MQRVYTLRLGRESPFEIVKELFLANLQLTGLRSHPGPHFKAILMAGGKLTLLRSLLREPQTDSQRSGLLIKPA
jgi:hypothetical protein